MPYTDFNLPSYPCTCDMWDALCTEQRPIVVYGMGNGADKLIRRFEKYGIEISDFFASDGFVRGHSFHGKKVKSFSEIKEEYEDFIIVLSFASNRSEVIEMLSDINSKYEMVVPDMPVAGEDEYFDREFFNSHYEEIIKAYASLADEDSKRAFSAVINYKLTGKMHYLLSAFSDKREIYSLINSRFEIRSLVDAGAYNGDTILEAVEFLPDFSFAYAIEPDPKNFKRLNKRISELSEVSIEAVNAAVFSECRLGTFSVSGNRNSTVSGTASFEHRESEINLVTVDSIVRKKVDYVKYDVEGAEAEALSGSSDVIKKYSPVLLVSLYHRSRDIFSLVNLISEKYPEYDLYIRRILCIPAWEIDLIALPGGVEIR